MKTVLTIAGSDCSGGAGIQADIKTMIMNGVYAMSAITALTAQNTTGVYGIQEASPEFLDNQLDCIFTDIFPDAVKIGMLSSSEIMYHVASKLRQYQARHIVLDPVMVSTSGHRLMNKDAEETLQKELFPLAEVITPNIPEAEEITNMKIETVEDMKKAGQIILNLGPKYVLMKGGHLNGDCVDILIGKDLFEVFEGERIDRKNTHGTGCTISSAITSHLALGYDIKEAVRLSKEYITEAIRHSFDIGKGVGPVHHFYKF